MISFFRETNKIVNESLWKPMKAHEPKAEPFRSRFWITASFRSICWTYADSGSLLILAPDQALQSWRFRSGVFNLEGKDQFNLISSTVKRRQSIVIIMIGCSTHSFPYSFLTDVIDLLPLPYWVYFELSSLFVQSLVKFESPDHATLSTVCHGSEEA